MEGVPDYRRVNNKFINDSVEIEKTVNIAGSTAGAGSGEFNRYRIQRRQERYRLAKLEFDEKQQQAAEEESKKKADKTKIMEDKRTKKADNRRKRKQKNKELKQAKKLNAFPNDGSFMRFINWWFISWWFVCWWFICW